MTADNKASGHGWWETGDPVLLGKMATVVVELQYRTPQGWKTVAVGPSRSGVRSNQTEKRANARHGCSAVAPLGTGATLSTSTSKVRSTHQTRL
ncbi:hypothetical protein GIY23_10440 [Allosaccharopolyspora coralli]|uniref:Uncharacterized protein n=1 Tax=Allosaccharopolyspora coralli TaxID=2665642 RepID=A0A5Q3Q5H9_9PSEU|nr:hypothetical protein [Allosaccharopolyspora coralli]QGK69881.1 hypothetical protein GIY23_10440 [Allosaccharopolyspora coralli]